MRDSRPPVVDRLTAIQKAWLLLQPRFPVPSHWSTAYTFRKVVRPISDLRFMRHQLKANRSELYDVLLGNACFRRNCRPVYVGPVPAFQIRSEEHTSELQSPDHLVC